MVPTKQILEGLKPVDDENDSITMTVFTGDG